ncbi:MAG TPA: regulatory iron-sulfur-containing complex subunit RicT, partial [Thermoanaerobaculia bacterium]|nr:regulatory iron-sulfur-containing complex subunit RicT [Thermoanaerobaculia bacterium]
MSLLVEVAFKGNRKEFFVWESDEGPPRAAPVIVDADRGEDLGRVHSVGPEAEHRSAKVPHGLLGAPATRVVKRLATPEELRRHEELRASDDEARRKAMERVKANALVMKMTDAEWQWDRKKLTFYFTAEKRVDFRTLVRELASMFRTRIELKQIGVRDEAKRLDGIGRCGRQYCSASWLPELRPVNLGVAKDQRLSLNPSQISGACGRLMCCLRYEHEFYVQSRRKYPKEGKVVRTSLGEEKVIANDIFRERVTLRGVEGEMRTIALTELRDEMTASGDALAAALEAAAHETSRDSSADETDDMVELVELVELESSGMDRSLASARPAPRSAPPARPARNAAPAPAPDVRRPAPPSRPRAEPPAAVSDPAATPAAGTPDEAGGEKRTQRRRGRRGGRRN